MDRELLYNQSGIKDVAAYIVAMRESLAAAEKEAEIYKGLYEAMLERALG